MCSSNPCGGSGSYPQLSDVKPVCVPCDGIGYKAPFRKEIPFKLSFIAQWYIEKLEQEKKFALNYYDFDGTIDLKDMDKHRPFLKRMRLDTVKLKDLFLGNKLLILGRQLVILAYCNEDTREYIEPKCERIFLMVRPEAMQHLPCIVQRLERCFKILRGKTFLIPKSLAYEMASEYNQEEDLLRQAVNSLDGKPGAVFFLMGENAVEKMRHLVGEDLDPQEALLKYHQSLRALFGLDSVRNGFFYTESPESTLQFASRFFAECPKCIIPTLYTVDPDVAFSTCCVIKPHIMKEGRTGVVMSDIVANGFTIMSFEIFWLNRRQAEEFYELYKRIFAEQEFMAMVDELAVGCCMALEIGFPNCPENVVECFRNTCGPGDSDLARKVRPNTLRACHGLNKIQNAMHCTELPEDAQSELEYFFKILGHKCNGVRDATGTICP